MIKEEGRPRGIPDAVSQPEQPKKPNVFKRMSRKKRIFLSTALVSASFLGGVGHYAQTHPEETSDFLRATVGNDNRLMIEGWVFSIQDKTHRIKYRFFGGRENPYGKTFTPASNPPEIVLPQEVQISLPSDPLEFRPPDVVLPPMPKQFELPKTTIIQPNPQPGEGIWAVDGLPYSTPDNFIMAKTYIRPDRGRPDSILSVLLLDTTKIHLNMMGGTKQPGNGPGKIPDSDLKNLIAAFNGGFQNDDGRFGMYAQEKLYMPMKNGAASLVAMKDGTIKMGTWGEGDLTAITSDMEAVRQNCGLLVKDGEVTADAENNGSNNELWGYIVKGTSDFITWRSAVGLDENGNLIVAAGNGLSAKTLAYGMKAAGAKTAMQLDINSPHSQIELYKMGSNGTLIPSLLTDMMTGRDLGRFYKTSERDFFFVLFDPNAK